MLTVEGTYKNGKVELAEKPAQLQQSRVLVTFLESNGVDLPARGMDETQAAELRALEDVRHRLGTARSRHL